MEDRERETLLREQYEVVVEQLLAKAHEADELCSTRGAELAAEQAARAALKEQLDALQHTYDMQVQAMTEYAAALQEQVGRLDVQLSDLRACHVRCGTCQSWNTVEQLTAPGAEYGSVCAAGDHPTLSFKR